MKIVKGESTVKQNVTRYIKQFSLSRQRSPSFARETIAQGCVALDTDGLALMKASNAHFVLCDK